MSGIALCHLFLDCFEGFAWDRFLLFIGVFACIGVMVAAIFSKR